MREPLIHEPVLLQEVLDTLDPRPGQFVIDCTLGHAGHAIAILRRLGDEGLLVGVDRDPQMLAEARRRIEAAGISGSRYHLMQANHADLAELLARLQATAPLPVPVADPAPAAVLIDLGPSTPQLLDPARGMSWTSDAPLDMRMDQGGACPTAAEIVNGWGENELADLFWQAADERWSRAIARRIVRERGRAPIRTARELGEIVAGAIPRAAWPPRTHPATRVFLALRIAVNDEYGTIERVLPAAFAALKPGGRLAVITFHSGEDRRVKQFMRELATAPQAPWPLPQGNAPAPGRLLTRKPLEPGPEEVARNPRSRSARLRAIMKQPSPEAA